MCHKVKSIVCITLVSMLVAFSGSAAFAAPEMVLKFAGQNNADHPATLLMREIAKEIGEKTDGRLEVKVYPASQLGDYSLVYEEQIRGTIDMSCISVPSQFDPRMELIYINGFASDYNDLKTVFAQDGWMFNKMNEFNERLGVKLLGFFVEGMIGTGTTKPANDPLNPEVNKGVLIRVPGMDVYKLAAEAMGYNSVGIPYADVYQAIQTGVDELTPDAIAVDRHQRAAQVAPNHGDASDLWVTGHRRHRHAGAVGQPDPGPDGVHQVVQRRRRARREPRHGQRAPSRTRGRRGSPSPSALGSGRGRGERRSGSPPRPRPRSRRRPRTPTRALHTKDR